jgi:membrane protein DedA with SNARE-associated domain
MRLSLPDALAPIGAGLDQYGYLAMVAVVMVESFGIPAPGQTILIVAGVYAATGHLNIVVVAVLGLLAAVGGDSLGYLIGRAGGRRLVLRVGRYVLLTEKRLDRAESFSRRHGRKVVVVARFVDGPRQLNGIVAGLVKMPFGRFVGWDAVGATVWAALFSGLGYLGGAHLNTLYDAILRYRGLVLAVLGVLVAGLVIRWARHRHALSPPSQV